MIQPSPRIVDETVPGAGWRRSALRPARPNSFDFKRAVDSADNGIVAAHTDFRTRLHLEDPVTAGATLADIPGARTPDVFMILGSLGVFAWTIVASEIVLLVH